MLTYQLSKQVFDDDKIALNYNNISFSDYQDKIMVELECDDVSFVNINDVVLFAAEYTFNGLGTVSVTDSDEFPVVAVNYNEKTICFTDEKFTNLEISSISAKIEDGVITWRINFSEPHYENAEGYFDLHLTYNYGLTCVIPVYCDNCYSCEWVFDTTIENSQSISYLIFGDIDTTVDGVVKGNVSYLYSYREQPRWNLLSGSYFPCMFTITKYKVQLTIPISIKPKTDLYKEGNINEYFIQHEEEKAINPPIEMEKYVYTPVVVKEFSNNTPVFEDCTKINFNLHFRVHEGDDWTVIDTDSWNFDKYGDNNTLLNNKYYSYAQNSRVPLDKWKRSCQSDLLSYGGFTTNDVKYQKNKLKKSFIRLSFYDSDDPGQQSLLAYSTIFVDCNKLYSKFISRMNFNCYFNSDGEIVKGIKVDREVNTSIGSDSLNVILGKSVSNTDDIEENRLSSQISVKNKFTSNNSSEGFYLYTWELNDNSVVPVDVYMKVEFNHAGYGRNIPMMAPYKDDPNDKGFKTNDDIINDWSGDNTGYGIKKYTRYSYIHLKVKYDTNTKRHIYYLDPDTYGTKWDWDKSVLNINLYEARITFD